MEVPAGVRPGRRRRCRGCLVSPGGAGGQSETGEHREPEDQEHDRAEAQAHHEPFARPVRPLVARDDVLQPAHDDAL